MALVKITDHTQQALDRLANQFQGKPLIEGLITAFTNQFQDLEQVLCDMLDFRSVLTSVGVQLDKIGQVVGEKRAGRDDDNYRQGIIAQIGINTSDGTPNDTFFVFNLITGSTKTILLYYPPATIQLWANKDISGLNIAQLYNDMQLTIPGGVGLNAIGWYAGGGDGGDDESFSFFESDTGLGFGDLDDPEVGGKLSVILVP